MEKQIVFKGQNDQVLTSSVFVVKTFGKEHKHVLDAVRELIKGCAEKSADPYLLNLLIFIPKMGRNILCLPYYL